MRQALQGANAIAGVWPETAGQKLSIYEALKKDLLQPDVAVALLEAQARLGTTLTLSPEWVASSGPTVAVRPLTSWEQRDPVCELEAFLWLPVEEGATWALLRFLPTLSWQGLVP
ncbi:hypothetical protein A6R68_07405, partial [Neotoma lepida]